MERKYLTRAEAAVWLTAQGLPVTRSQLQKLATVGGGPEYAVFGNKALYMPEHLLVWAEARLAATRKG